MTRVLLLGDSIRMGMQKAVADALGGDWQVVGPEENCSDTRTHLEHLDEWVGRPAPDLVQINAGLHDLKLHDATGERQVPLEEYEANLRRILERLRELAPNARLIWATSTPVIEDKHNAAKPDFNRYNADIDHYNTAARAIATRAGFEINDLHAVVIAAGVETCICDDGVHLTDAGNRTLAAATADFFRNRP